MARKLPPPRVGKPAKASSKAKPAKAKPAKASSKAKPAKAKPAKASSKASSKAKPAKASSKAKPAKASSMIEHVLAVLNYRREQRLARGDGWPARDATTLTIAADMGEDRIDAQQRPDLCAALRGLEKAGKIERRRWRDGGRMMTAWCATDATPAGRPLSAEERARLDRSWNVLASAIGPVGGVDSAIGPVGGVQHGCTIVQPGEGEGEGVEVSLEVGDDEPGEGVEVSLEVGDDEPGEGVEVSLEVGDDEPAKKTREAWLAAALVAVRARFAACGHPCAARIRVSLGFAAGSRKPSRIDGNVHWAESSADQTHEMFVSPMLADPVEVIVTIVHEVCHVAAGMECGHGVPFQRVAAALGLKAPWRSTPADLELLAWSRELAEQLGPYDHAKLIPGGRTQPTRMIKVKCGVKGCKCGGYIVRTTRKWLNMGPPACPWGGLMEEIE
jgi:hypothetical protein